MKDVIRGCLEFEEEKNQKKRECREGDVDIYTRMSDVGGNYMDRLTK